MHDFFHDLRNETPDVLPQTLDFMVSHPNIAEDLVRGIMGKMSVKDQLAFWWKCCSWIPIKFRDQLEDHLARSEEEDRRAVKEQENKVREKDPGIGESSKSTRRAA